MLTTESGSEKETNGKQHSAFAMIILNGLLCPWALPMPPPRSKPISTERYKDSWTTFTLSTLTISLFSPRLKKNTRYIYSKSLNALRNISSMPNPANAAFSKPSLNSLALSSIKKVFKWTLNGSRLLLNG